MPIAEDIADDIGYVPFFVPTLFKHTVDVQDRLNDNWSGDVIVMYRLNWLQRYFVLWEHESSSRLSFILSVLMACTVLLSIVIFILGSGSLIYYPSTCADPACNNDPILCPGKMICEPQQLPFFDTIDSACVFVFTIDYLSRMLTVWSVSPRLAGLTVDALDSRPKLIQVLGYFLRMNNIIDVVSIVPFYVSWIQYRGMDHQSSGFVRVLRIPRVLRILNVSKRFGTVNVIIEILRMTLAKSGKALTFTIFFIGLGTLVFASIMYVLEQGTFVVSSQYPDGAFLRENVYGDPQTEKSTFTDISVSMYYVIVTLTTLGYGDLVPASPGGRAVAVLLCFGGILVLALPIAVIGHHFVELYRVGISKMEQLNTLAQIDTKRTKVQLQLAALVAPPASASAPVLAVSAEKSKTQTMDLCGAHERFCCHLTEKATFLLERSSNQSEQLQRTYFDLQTAIAMIIDELDEEGRREEEADKGTVAVNTSINASMSDTLQNTNMNNASGSSFGYPGVSPQGDFIPPASEGPRPFDSPFPPSAPPSPSSSALPLQYSPSAKGHRPIHPEFPDDLDHDQHTRASTAFHDTDTANNKDNGNDNGKDKEKEKNMPTAVALDPPPTAGGWTLFVPPKFVFRKKRPDMFFPERIYPLTPLQRMFVMLEHPRSCIVGFISFLLLICTVVIGVVSLVLASEPMYLTTPSTCAKPVCPSDYFPSPPNQPSPPCKPVCEPVPPDYFSTIDDIVVYVFTADYALRLLLCGTVPRRLANVIPDDWDDNERKAAEEESRHPRTDPPPYSTWYQMLCYFFQFQNLVDLLAIIPHYIQITFDGPSLSIFRVMRLTRVMSISKLSGMSAYAYVMTETLRRSVGVLVPLAFFVCLLMVLSGCLIFVVEQGTYMVTVDNPYGAYLRPNLLGTGMEASPFTTISASMYYVVVTSTTVGYGDMYPTR